tara:strand:- start:92 stop:397 length:306 start_codon:yes stop_codon:yes gene_type:complete
MSNTTDYEFTIVGNRPWIYFFSGKKPKGSLNNYWFYFLEKPFVINTLLKQHEELLKMPKGKIFFVENAYLVSDFRNKFLEQILANSSLLNRQHKFSIFEIK